MANCLALEASSGCLFFLLIEWVSVLFIICHHPSFLNYRTCGIPQRNLYSEHQPSISLSTYQTPCYPHSFDKTTKTAQLNFYWHLHANLLHSGLKRALELTYRPAGGAGAVPGDVVARPSVLTGAALLAVRPVTPGGAALAAAVGRHVDRSARERRRREDAGVASSDTHKAPEYPGGQTHSPVS